MSLLIILNPVSGRLRGPGKRQLLEDLIAKYARGSTWKIVETSSRGEAATIAAQAASEGYTRIAAAGGDGTLSEVLDGVMRAENPLPLGILPVGTGNDFSRCLGIGTDLDLAARTLFDGEVRMVDVGIAHLSGQSHHFINICGCGFDALIAERINAGRKHPIRRLLKGTPAYVTALLAELLYLKAAKLTMHLDGEIVNEPVLLCAVANSTSYGGGMLIAPDASVEDGIFDICTIREAGRLEFLRAFPGVFSGQHIHHPKVTMRRAKKIRVESEPPLPILVDGDVCGFTPAEFEILPQRIPFLFPGKPSP